MREGIDYQGLFSRVYDLKCLGMEGLASMDPKGLTSLVEYVTEEDLIVRERMLNFTNSLIQTFHGEGRVDFPLKNLENYLDEEPMVVLDLTEKEDELILYADKSLLEKICGKIKRDISLRPDVLTAYVAYVGEEVRRNAEIIVNGGYGNNLESKQLGSENPEFQRFIDKMNQGLNSEKLLRDFLGIYYELLGEQ